ncbi:regulator of volume decrease after cellular swelling-domain-containing protein [Xylariomycetidae sp. FL0641]|nr:regulator of volume decrease after cellular swelling-domain-containing protein [Xylariomycetidae sp. FL0641]
MLPTVIKNCPSADNDFQPLSEYEAQTPETFFDGKPVLYYHDESTKAWVSNEQYERLYFFAKQSDDNDATIHPTPPESHALENNGGKHLREEQKLEVFVTSNKLILFSHKSGTGIEIPYPAITLHAIKNFRSLAAPDDDAQKFIGVYMQLEFSDAGAGADDDDDESFDPIELTLVPYKAAPSDAVDALNAQRTNALFNQISACSNLNPDPRDGDEDDEDDDADRIVFESNVEPGAAVEGLPGVLQGDGNGGLPPPMPGSSGWITADNVHEYFDEEGNWIGQQDGGVSGELGDGAGRVRGRDEVDQDGANGTEDGEDSETKRPRTE